MSRNTQGQNTQAQSTGAQNTQDWNSHTNCIINSVVNEKFQDASNYLSLLMF